MNELDVIENLANILTRTEVFIQHNGDKYLPHQRSRFIDMATLSVADIENDFMDYDRIKTIVTNFVQLHLCKKTKWFVDMTQTTEDQVVLISDNSYESLTIPTYVYFNFAFMQNFH